MSWVLRGHLAAPGKAVEFQQELLAIKGVWFPCYALSRSTVLGAMGFEPNGAPGSMIKDFCSPASLAYRQHTELDIDMVFAIERNLQQRATAPTGRAEMELLAHAYVVADAARELRAANGAVATLIIPRSGADGGHATNLNRVNAQLTWSAADKAWAGNERESRMLRFRAEEGAVVVHRAGYLAVAPPGHKWALSLELGDGRSNGACSVASLSVNESPVGPASFPRWATSTVSSIESGSVLAARAALASLGGPRAASKRVAHVAV